MRTRHEGLEAAKKDYAKIDGQIYRAKEWVHRRLLSIPQGEEDAALVLENGFLAEIRDRFGDDYSRIVSELFRRDGFRNGEQDRGCDLQDRGVETIPLWNQIGVMHFGG